MSALTDLQAKVAANTSVDQSAITLLQGLKQRLDDALANNDTAALQQLSADLGSSNDALAAAVSQNTPAAPISNDTANPNG